MKATTSFLSVSLSLALLSCASKEPEVQVQSGKLLLVAPKGADPALERALVSLRTYVDRITGSPSEILRLDGVELSRLTSEVSERKAHAMIVVDAHKVIPSLVSPVDVEKISEQAFLLDVKESSTSADSTPIVLTASKGKLGSQYAIYEVLRRLGVRFFHPEQEFVPVIAHRTLKERLRTATALSGKDNSGKVKREHVPDFRFRGYSFHGAHPLEIIETFTDPKHPIDEAVRIQDWTLKNFAQTASGGARGMTSAEDKAKRGAEIAELRKLLGLRSGAGITLHNEQQGATAQIDRTSSIPVKQQIETIVTSGLQSNPEAQTYGIHFGPTEFTVTPDQETVDWITWAGNKALELRPDVRVLINNHTTGSQPTPNFSDLGCPQGTNTQSRGDYYDLSFHTDKRFGVNVHTVMFYPLEGPAYVYNQKTFSHKLCLMQKASAMGRPIWYFPEGSWWLSFDNTVPVYLPLYIQTRARDIELIKPLLPRNGGTLEGHRMFNSGQEWGYWQQDYAVGLMSFNADVTLQDVVNEITDPFCDVSNWPSSCEAKDAVKSVLTEMMSHQVEMFLNRPDYAGRPGGLYAYFAGEDPADEIAAVTGFEFRPVRVSFNQLLSWSEQNLQNFEKTDLTSLDEMIVAYSKWQKRLTDVSPKISPMALPWFREIADGVDVNLARAKHTHALYQTIITYRRAQIKKQNGESIDPKTAASSSFAKATEALALAQDAIKRRESSYRYPPAQTIVGGRTPETAIPNGTTYPYRVYALAHLLSYWNNRQSQVLDILDGKAAGNDLVIDPAIGPVGTVATLLWPSAKGLKASIDFGDGQKGNETITTHTYGNLPAVYPIQGQMQLDSQTLAFQGHVVRTAIRALSPRKGFSLIKPDSKLAKDVLSSIVPAFHWGWVSKDATHTLAFAPESRMDGKLDFRRVIAAPVASFTNGVFASAPKDVKLPVSLQGSNAVREVTLSTAIFSGTATIASDGTVSSIGSKVKLNAQIVIRDLVDALIAFAGFDEKGAYTTLSSILNFDPKNPPQTVPTEAEFTLQ